MFRFRGKRTDRDEWVTGWLGIYKSPFPNSPLIYNIKVMELNRDYDVHKESISISTGKLDSTGTEIFASFEIDGKMTEGGDVVKGISGGAYPIFYNADNTSFELKLRRIGKEVVLGSLDTTTLTIIGKGGEQ